MIQVTSNEQANQDVFTAPPVKMLPLRTKKLDGTELPVNNDTDSQNTSNLHYALC
jgi:hypothetical protein